MVLYMLIYAYFNSNSWNDDFAVQQGSVNIKAVFLFIFFRILGVLRILMSPVNTVQHYCLNTVQFK